jgi:hypothetical protein
MLMLKQSKQNNKINPKHLLTAYQQKIEKSLINKGVILFDNKSGLLNINDEYLVMPDMITDILSRDLGEYLNAYTQNKVYIRTMLGRIELLAEEARRNYFDVSDPLYRK